LGGREAGKKGGGNGKKREHKSSCDVGKQETQVWRMVVEIYGRSWEDVTRSNRGKTKGEPSHAMDIITWNGKKKGYGHTFKGL